MSCFYAGESRTTYQVSDRTTALDPCRASFPVAVFEPDLPLEKTSLMLLSSVSGS